MTCATRTNLPRRKSFLNSTPSSPATRCSPRSWPNCSTTRQARASSGFLSCTAFCEPLGHSLWCPQPPAACCYYRIICHGDRTQLRPRRLIPALLTLAAAFGSFAPLASAQNSVEGRLRASYRDVYNVKFQDALQQAQEAGRLSPADPMPPIAEANAILFREFDRLRVLRSETFASDDG